MDFSDQLKKCTLSPEFITLFSSIKGVLFFVKNRDCVIIGGNQLIAEHMGFKKPEDFYGKTDFEIFPRELAERYYNDDLEVLKTQKPKTNIVELFPNYLGDLAWFNTSKIPLFPALKSIGASVFGRSLSTLRKVKATHSVRISIPKT